MVMSESIPGSELELTPEGGSSSRSRSYLKTYRFRTPGFTSSGKNSSRKAGSDPLRGRID